MKNLLTKILFTSLFLSAAISSDVQACFLADSLGAAQKGQKAVVIAIATALPVVATVAVKAAITGDVGGAVMAGEKAIEKILESAKVTGVVIAAGVIVVGAGKVLADLRKR